MASTTQSEITRQHSNTAKVLDLFKAHPNIWIDWTELAKVGGALAWRTRVADCRRIVKADGGAIENRQERILTYDEATGHLTQVEAVLSKYRYVPAESWPSFDAPIQETFTLTPPETR